MTNANPKDNAKLIDILQEAQIAYEKEMIYFDGHNDENKDPEMKNIYWARSTEYSGKCEGLLTAYEILTGRCLFSHQIKDELKRYIA